MDWGVRGRYEGKLRWDGGYWRCRQRLLKAVGTGMDMAERRIVVENSGNEVDRLFVEVKG